MRPVGVILAGGLSSRMGSDKALVDFGGRPLVTHAIERLSPQVEALAINANGDPRRFDFTGLPVLPDPLPGQHGPLVGILAALYWAGAMRAKSVVTLPLDTPFAPADLVKRLLAARAPAVAVSEGRRHPIVGLWPVSEAASLAAALASGVRAVRDWEVAERAHAVEFRGPVDPFLNLNRPDDLAEAEKAL